MNDANFTGDSYIKVVHGDDQCKDKLNLVRMTLIYSKSWLINLQGINKLVLITNLQNSMLATLSIKY